MDRNGQKYSNLDLQILSSLQINTVTSRPYPKDPVGFIKPTESPVDHQGHFKAIFILNLFAMKIAVKLAQRAKNG